MAIYKNGELLKDNKRMSDTGTPLPITSDIHINKTLEEYITKVAQLSMFQKVLSEVIKSKEIFDSDKIKILKVFFREEDT